MNEWILQPETAGFSRGPYPLTSHPFISTLYGMVPGMLIASNFH